MELGPTSALAGALEGLLVVDRAGLFMYANPAAEKILGLPASEIVEGQKNSRKKTILPMETKARPI
jgi:PAS domain S-box-containing protein